MAITSKVVRVTNSDGVEVEYTIQAFTATKGLRIFQKLAKLIGPAFKTLSESSDEEEASAKAIAVLLETLDDVELDKLLPELLSGVNKGGQAINFDIEFMANAGAMVKLAQEVVSLNWGSLFSVLGSAEE